MKDHPVQILYFKMGGLYVTQNIFFFLSFFCVFFFLYQIVGEPNFDPKIISELYLMVVVFFHLFDE